MKAFVNRVDIFKPFVDKKERDLYEFLKEASVLNEGTLKCMEKEKNKKSFKLSNPDWE